MPGFVSASDPALDAFATHGGRLSQARARFPAAPAPWIDLSTGINPLPYPAAFATAADRARLPDPEEIEALEAAAADAFGIAPACVLATPGGEAAIRLLAEALPARTAGVMEPTYSSHQRSWRDAGKRVKPITVPLSDAVAQSVDALILVNPNNPDGGSVPAADLADLASRVIAPREGWLIVDEAFVECAPQLSVATLFSARWSAERLVAIRSFGKFYGLPGVRLGFITAHPALIAQLRRRQGAWPVSADAIAAGIEAYSDREWAEATRIRLYADAARLDDLLRRAGFQIIGGTSLFRLAAAEDAARRFSALAARGVLTRPFDYAPSWLRFGLPAPEHWPRVEAALMETAR